ncbi:glycoside hydrolase family 16 protein [Asticcacaulis sp. 201]|uniref:glycoside hydrolase family 16 protein n=1 Tax=Asticcacaulis sp. 201 TaxID=3028787 RepID=UPI002916812E|nr:glycoside hydrolase family 16 protein [Asticcacaulis sp. 201]MDV6330872.1 glycoside hydrolase family 16 protein [Asticcacaulis sp. 201]
MSHTHISCLVVMALFMPLAANADPSIAPAKDSLAIDEPGGVPTGYTLKWSDEFDTPGLPNPALWRYDTKANKTGWANHERQYYANARPENSRVEDGTLIIEARKEDLKDKSDWGGQHYSSARLLSKKTYKYGYVEVRAQLPCGLGVWPAIWQLPATDRLKWPDDGEIDIMEYVGWDKDVIYHTIHTGLYNHVKGTQKGILKAMPAVCGQWHTYSLLWTPNEIKEGIDGRYYFHFRNDGKGNTGTWPFDRAHNLILNLAVGGDFGGKTGVDDSSLPWQFKIDYVRVYQKQ